MFDHQPIAGSIPFENIPSDTSTSGYVDKLIAFLEEYLPTFSSETGVKASRNENDLTEELYKHLTRKCKFNAENKEYPYAFQPEKSQKKINEKGHSKRIDIAARLNTLDVNMEVIYCIEAKKLPTDKVGGKREKEYVLGNGGGIERFKSDRHGLNDYGNLLERNGIIAYVVENTFEHWQGQINQWITEDSERLTLEYFSGIAKLHSVHQRVSGSKLQLTHFWVGISE